jgi:hypothetical protein
MFDNNINNINNILKFGKYKNKNINKIRDDKYMLWVIENYVSNDVNREYYEYVILKFKQKLKLI